VALDQPIVEIMTDKVNTELPSPAAGILSKILIEEGSLVGVFQAMGIIDDGTEAAADAPAEEKKAEPAPATQRSLESPSKSDLNHERQWLSPVVKVMAKEHGLSEADLSQIQGTGSGGRVTKRDIEAFVGKSTPVAAPEVKLASTEVQSSGPDQEIMPLAGMRKMIAEAMVRSSQVPVVSTLTEVDVTPMIRFREANKDSFQATYGVKLTYTPFFLKALTETLVEFPLLNASLQDGNIVMNRKIHLGVAVSLGSKGDEGLIVPIIRDCASKSLIDLAKELEEIAGKARSNTLAVSDVQGGTFTLTNPGSYGAILGTPMINAPQAAILGIYGIKKMPVVIDDMIGIRSVMNMVITYDHRLIDGLLAGRFLQALKARLEKFDFFK
jgi:pyruvate/2-oxoglutarate dehydrogenase complex dihydrolipoamide acyltransferase (E2) component